MSYAYTGVLLVLILSLSGYPCFQWLPNLPHGTVLYACVGDDLLLPWNYTTSPGDDITSTQWFVVNQSQQLIAIFSQSNFLPTPSFSNRAQQVGDAGLSLSHMTTGDTGIYSVDVSGHNASGSFFDYRRSVVVQIMEKNRLLTTDSQLHAELEPKAIYNSTAGDWSLVLTCGNFTFVGDAPFNMEWLTPTGEVLPSVNYSDGRFQLHVTLSGDYTCRIPQKAVRSACLEQNTSRSAKVHVDNMEARVILLEARLAQLQKENNGGTGSSQDGNITKLMTNLEREFLSMETMVARLQKDNEQLKLNESSLAKYVQSLEARLTAASSSLTERCRALETQMDKGKVDDANLTRFVRSVEARSDTAMFNLTDHVRRLEERLDSKDATINGVVQSVLNVTDKLVQRVAFTAWLSNNHTKPGTVVFDNIVTNIGNAYSPHDGIFTTSVPGLYLFALTSTPVSKNEPPNANLGRDGSVFCETVAPPGVTGEVSSCFAVIHLSVGQKVWARSDGQLSAVSTSFSGYLLSSD